MAFVAPSAKLLSQAHIRLEKNVQNGCKNPIRILTLDGGGLRGIISVQILKEIEKQSGKRIHELFDLIVGTSTGGLIALGVGTQKKLPLNEVERIYNSVAKKVFKYPIPWWGYKHKGPGKLSSNYDYKKLEQVFQDEFTQLPLIDAVFDEQKFKDSNNNDEILVGVMSVLSNHPTNAESVLLRNYDINGKGYVTLNNDLMYPGFCNLKIWEAARATSAAPHFFDALETNINMKELGINKGKFIDGGVNANLPMLAAYCESVRIWPDRPVFIVSIGTGSCFVDKKEELLLYI